MYYPLCGFLTLFANTLQNPEDECVASDLQLMDLVISFLYPMMAHASPLNITAAVKGFQELGNVARKFVEKTNANNTKGLKRAYDKDDANPKTLKRSIRTPDIGTIQSNADPEALNYTVCALNINHFSRRIPL